MFKLEVQDISKSFGSRGAARHVVLDHVNLQVPNGQFVSLLGPSGCGKTTLLSIVAGFVRPDEGAVLVEGRAVSGPGPDRAVVFQNYALFPWMTVKGNILYPMKQQRLPADEQETMLQELLRLAGLEGKEHLYPGQLSGGMKQRTAVVRALACRPKILLMDEPLGAVDYQMRQTLQVELEGILRQGAMTTMMVTHDVEEAVFMSDRVVVMSSDAGHIVETVEVDLPRPRNRRSQRYQGYVHRLIDLLQQASTHDATQASVVRRAVLR